MSDEDRWFPEISLLRRVMRFILVIGVAFITILAFITFSDHPYRLAITFSIAGFGLVLVVYWLWYK